MQIGFTVIKLCSNKIAKSIRTPVQIMFIEFYQLSSFEMKKSFFIVDELGSVVDEYLAEIWCERCGLKPRDRTKVCMTERFRDSSPTRIAVHKLWQIIRNYAFLKGTLDFVNKSSSSSRLEKVAEIN